MRGIDLTGKKFGEWIVIEKAIRPLTKSPSKPNYWKCKCSCGNERIIPAHNLRCKLTTNCGCKNLLPDFSSLYYLISHNHHNVECFLSFSEFLEFTKITKCHYCNAEIHWSKRTRSAYNLDRMDNKLAYTKENCVVCCKRCNFGKGSNFTYEEWYGMTEYLRKKQS